MKLVSEWRHWWRMFSVWAMGIAAAVQGAWSFIPPEMQASVPDSWLRAATAILMALGIAGRLIDQPKVKP